MNRDLIEKWRAAEEARRAYADSFEAWLKDQAETPSIVQPAPLIMPPGVIKQFSGADGVHSWDGARNMTTPLQKHSISNATTPSFVEGGPPSLSYMIMPGDPQWSKDAEDDSPRRRVEFSWEPWRFPMGEDCWAGGAFFLPSDPMRNNAGTSIYQLHNWPNIGVMWNLHVAGGRLKSEHKHFDFEFNDLLDAYLDKWNGMVINFRASTEDDGFIKMWLNGQLALAYSGPTRQGGGEGPYLKNGLYFWGYERFGDVLKRALAYHDRLRIGVDCGYDAVDPDRW